MKIANSEIIKKREQEWFGAIAANLDWEAIRQVLRDKHGLSIGDDVKYRRAGIDVKENRILYSIDFDVNITLSIQLDRDGELIGVRSSRLEDPVMQNVEKEGHQESQVEGISTSDIEMDDPEESGGVEKELPEMEEDEAAPDESEGGYEDVLMEFGSGSSGKPDNDRDRS
ncbi:MAG TPA: hypothetical protein HPP90_09505 [Deltaproteobacteria bacterium]|nr:hypothetical protein [Deltaproteobacteria bacterium]